MYLDVSNVVNKKPAILMVLTAGFHVHKRHITKVRSVFGGGGGEDNALSNPLFNSRLRQRPKPSDSRQMIQLDRDKVYEKIDEHKLLSATLCLRITQRNNSP